MGEKHHMTAIGSSGDACRAPQQRLDFGLEDLQLEGLGQVVICTGGISGEGIGGIAQVREHEDWDARGSVMAAEPGRQLEAVQLRHPHVSDDEVRYFFMDELEGFDPVAGLAHGVARPLEVATDHLLDHAVVVD